MINPTNPQLLLAWQANVDIQMGSVFVAAVFVSHYICKDESKALKKVIAENLACLPQEACVHSRLSKIGNTVEPPPAESARGCIPHDWATSQGLLSSYCLCVHCPRGTCTHLAKPPS